MTFSLPRSAPPSVHRDYDGPFRAPLSTPPPPSPPAPLGDVFEFFLRYFLLDPFVGNDIKAGSQFFFSLHFGHSEGELLPAFPHYPFPSRASAREPQRTHPLFLASPPVQRSTGIPNLRSSFIGNNLPAPPSPDMLPDSGSLSFRSFPPIPLAIIMSPKRSSPPYLPPSVPD